ncbi:MAG: type II toxin-antitoxin system RelE/ParE family toxin [Candidatus Omnitrophica bacterium]|nr:type II toxin-antitoxin system RelE/ParE family toxin [Candidatus Omnitrophota bacterium]
MKLRILDSALRDLEQGWWFYESQGEGVGNYFLTSLGAEIEKLRLTAGMHAIAHEDYHRALSGIFPFAIYYTKSAEEVTVYAVVDCRRDPAWIREHLEGSG